MTKISGKELWELCSVPVPELRLERFQRLHRMMDVEGLDALVVLASATLGQKGNLRYVTNYRPISRHAGVVFPRHGTPVLFVPYAVHVVWAEKTSWVDEARFSPDFAKDMSTVLQERGIAAGDIGLVGQDTIPGLQEALGKRLPGAKIRSAASPLSGLRLVKGPLEVSLARHAASMADRVLAKTASLVAEGATEADIFATSEAELRRLNAEESLLLVDSVGGQVTPFPTQRAIRPGDLVQYSVEPVSPGGHWIQSVRMFSRGEPDPSAGRIVETFLQALAAAQAALVPGVPLSQVAGIIAEALTPIAPQGRIPYGHGIGMDNFEPPLLNVDSDVVVEPNMVIVIHPGLMVEGQSYYLGDTYLVTPDGGQRLTRYPLELIVV